ncbi:hypothetical protein CAEBREN_09147 [Caenorhabditis brenneri]|uniref:F-box domain-containing protein n=1 Tax=Caenorhabditis brenneri TaxID=135651 RepID=G0NGH9_CAEBE|nr:hypothetical protein CAEBREN_09147 [Caenorhabditis brenneri]
MPIEVVDIIVGKVDAASKLSVRKTSKILRSIADSQKTKCHSVSLSLYRSFSKLCIENSSITYRSEKDASSKLLAVNEYDSSDSDGDSPKWKPHKWAKMKTVVDENHLKAAINDFSSFLINPNWKFEEFTIDFGSGQGSQWREVKEAKLIKALDPLLSKFQIHVENLTILLSTTTFEKCTLKFHKDLEPWDEHQDRNEIFHIDDIVKRVFRFAPEDDSYTKQYYDEASCKSYTITAPLYRDPVELKIEHEVYDWL